MTMVEKLKALAGYMISKNAMFTTTSRRFYSIPEVIRMFITAITGAGIGFITYELIYWLNPLVTFRATTSWTVSFILGVVRQHGLHRLLTFTHRSPYWKSLTRAYLFYSISALFGALLNYFFTVHLMIHHRLAWLACLAVTALMSMLFLKRLVFIRHTDQ